MRFPANCLGPQIRRLRVARGFSQSKFAIQLQLRGLDMGRDVLARIECQIHCLKDRDIPFFARALEVNICQLYLGAILKAPGQARHICAKIISKKL